MQKIMIAMMLLSLSALSYAMPKTGLYKGYDYEHGKACYLDIKKIDYNGLRPSRLNTLIYANLGGFDFRLQYKRSYDMQTGELDFDPSYLFDIIQIQYSIFSGELHMDPKTNHTTVKSYRYINNKRYISYCDELKYIGSI